MHQVTGEVWAALGETVGSETVAQAQYQGRTARLNVAAEGGLTWDADGEIQCNGSLRAFGFGGSLVPKSRDDLLAPFGQEVTVSRVVKLRSGDVVIPLGVFRVTGNDGGREGFRWDSGRRTRSVLDWEVGVDLADRFRMLQRAKIVNPASPRSGGSVYSEIQRLTPFPMLRHPQVSDRAVPVGTVYDDRRSAVSMLAGFAGAKPRITRQGALTLRPADRWASVSTPEWEIAGAVNVERGQSDEFYNAVWAHSPDGKFSAFVALNDRSDPRSVPRAGESTYEHSSPIYTSLPAAQSGALSVLNRLLNRRSSVATCQVGLQGLLVDLSDVGRVVDPGTGVSVTGEVSAIRVSHDPTSLVEIDLIVGDQ